MPPAFVSDRYNSGFTREILWVQKLCDHYVIDIPIRLSILGGHSLRHYAEIPYNTLLFARLPADTQLRGARLRGAGVGGGRLLYGDKSSHFY